MLLTVEDRLLILDVLPATGTLTTLKIIADLQQRLSFDESEHAALKFVETDGLIRWDTTAETAREIEIGVKAQDVIKQALDKLNATGQLRLSLLPLCEKFGVTD